MDSLTDRERAMLDLEQQWWATAAGKEDAITAMGLSPTRYYQLLGRLLATERALAYAAVTVNRLRRISTQRQRGRPMSRDFGLEHLRCPGVGLGVVCEW